MRTKVKILLVLLLIGIIYFCFGKNEVQAKQLSTPLYFGINEMRTLSTPNLGYAIGNPRNNDQDGKGIKLWNILKYSTSTSNDPTEVDVYCVKSGVGFANDTHRRATYNFEFNMYTEREEIAAKSTTLNGLVNGGHYNELLALANILYLAEDETEDLEAYLKKAGISKEYWDELLTVDEVKAVQQAAIWYFTNYGEENGKYDKTKATTWLNYTTDGSTYTSLSDYGLGNNRVGEQRQKQAEILYKYLIKTAKANSGNYEDTSKNYKTKLVLYTAQGVYGEEQPLMEIEREKQFDLSLRKYITKVNNVSVNISREPQIDLTYLKNETKTTATYKHKKDPILVQNGDIVTYSIRIYNEGDVDGYVNKIVDQLPTGLKFNKLITTGYMATYDEENNIVTITRNEDNKDRLIAFDGNNLDYTTLEIECTVNTQEGDKVLTNVAWIAEEQTIDGNIITSEVGDDRDSEPSTKPDVNKDNMEDYKGKDDNKDDLTDKDYFYEGQQDDDDFEKLITKKLEGSYNLQIVKVDNENEEVKLSGAEFKVTMPDGSSRTETTDGSGVINLGSVAITETGIDNIKFEELNAPEGYEKLFNSFELDVTKEEQGGKYVATKVDLKNSSGSGEGTVKVNNDNGTITVTVPNSKLEGSYNLQIVKVDNEDEEVKLSGAEFKITMPDGSSRTETTDGSGVINLGSVAITETGIDNIKFEELNAPEGYEKLFNSFELDVTKEEQGGKYVATKVDLKNSSGSGEATVKVNNDNGTITVTVPNSKLEGSYNLQIVKVDNEDEEVKLSGAEFKITMPDGSSRTETTDGSGVINLGSVAITETGVDNIKFEELNAPEGYEKLFNSFELDVTKEEQGGKYVATKVDLKNSSGSGEATVKVNNDNGTITVTVPNSKLEGSYNLQIVKVDNEDEEVKLSGAEFKITMPDGSSRTETTDGSGVINLGSVAITETGVDNIKFEELNAPEGYEKLFNSFELDVTKEEQGGKYVATKVDLKNSSGSGEGTVKVNNDNGTITVTVPNSKLDGNYNLQIVKVDNGNEEVKLSGAEFKITMPDGSSRTETTDGSGVINLGSVAITETGVDNIKFEELNAPEGYEKLFNSFELDVTKEEQGGKYVATKVDLKNSSGSGEGTVKVNNDNGTITVTVPNSKLDGSYNLQIVKVDSNDEKVVLEGAEFKITMPDGSSRTETTDGSGVINLGSVAITETGVDNIKFEELNAPEGYEKLFNSFELDVTKEEQGGKYVATKVDLKNSSGSGEGTVKVNNDNGTITVTVPNSKLEGSYNLQIVKVDSNDEKVVLEGAEFKITMPDGSSRTETTDGSGVINLGSVAITETGVDNIKFEELNAPEGYEKLFNSFELDVTKEEQSGKYVVTNVNLKNSQGSGITTGEIKVNYSNGMITVTVPNSKLEGSYNLQIVKVDSNDEKVVLEGAEFKVTMPDGSSRTETTNESGYIDIGKIDIKNVQEKDLITIEETKAPTGYNGIQGKIIVEVEKQENNGIYSLKNATVSEENANVEIDGENIFVYVKNTKIIEFDLALRKFIIAVSSDENIDEEEYLKNNDGSYTREPVVDTSLLNTTDSNGNKITTAIYNHTKEPVLVEKGNYIVYMIRVYNEGDIAGYASEIKDHLPPYLEFVDNEFNSEYGWEVSEDGRTVTTRYLENSLINATEKNEEGAYVLSYLEIPIMCKIVDSAPQNENITNIADITEYQDEDKKPVEDRDSQEDNVELPEDEELPNYKDEEKGEYVPGQQDDDDFEKIIIREKEFDLALRKFIIAISNDEEISDSEYLTNTDGSYTRAPVVDTSLLNTTDENGNMITTAIYNHTKEPLMVKVNDYVIYMLRVYNEGEVDGYASEIKDHLPPYLEFVDNEFNSEYGWEVSEDGRTVTTRYLENSLIDAAEKNEEGTYVLSYVEVPIMCRITDDAPTSENITNIADITEYQDENKNPTTDRDSQEDNVELPEDDELPGYKDEEEGEYIPGQQDDDDFEKVIIKEFDLSLRKWVTQAIVIDDKGETITETGHQPYDDPEEIVKVEIYRKSINDVTVKFRYKIRVTNEGEIEGYAKEITDYVPEGLRFLPEDNPGWTDEGNNVISTRLLENTLLQPGEYAEVEVVLTWINDADNMGVKINTAEISEDYNDYDVPDKDSTPDNQEEGEDDIDDAKVLLSVSTGQIRIYFTLGFIVLITVASGIVLIKKFVL